MRKPAGLVDPAGCPNFLSGRCLPWRVTALRRCLFRNRWRRGQASRPVHRSELGRPHTPGIYTVQIYMSSSNDDLNELSLLMELPLAFGPGTRLWAYRSREDLCYDWLHFKERRANACFREFALGLYIQEKEQALHCASLSAISKARCRDLEGVSGQETTSHCAGHRQPAAVEWWPGPQHHRGRQTLSLGELPVAQALFPDANSPPPLRENEVAH